MSRESKKKQLRIRLDNLFSELSEFEGEFDLPEEGAPLPSEGGAPGWIWACDSQGNYTACSPEVQTVLGFEPGELIGQPVAEFAVPPRSGEAIQAALQGGSYPTEINVKYHNKAGALLDVSLHVFSGASDGSEGWNGFAQLVGVSEEEDEEATVTAPEPAEPLPPITSDLLQGGLVIEGERVIPAQEPLTPAGEESLGRREPVVKTTDEDGRAVLAAPFSLQEKTLGVLELVDDDPNRVWSEDDLLLVEQVADQLSLALENAYLFQQTQQALAQTDEQARRLAVLNEMARAFSEALDEASIVEGIYNYASRLIDIHDFYIALYHPNEERISFPLVIEAGQRVTPEHSHWEEWQPRPAGEGLTGYILQERTPILLEDRPTERLREMGVPFLEHGDPTQCWMGVPLVLGRRVLGVIAAQSDTTPRLYDEQDLELLTAIASQAAIAIENARLFQLEQRRAEQERTVRTITDRVRSGGDAQSILRIARQELQQALGAKRSAIRISPPEKRKPAHDEEGDASEQEEG